jgi:MOSC domain-containing protein YiiM
MKVVAVSVGLPREVEWRGQTVRTSIWKEPVNGPVRVRRVNLEGDHQSDLSVHGGAQKAIYVYPSEHYEYWRQELPGTELPWAVFGENFTTLGLLEAEMHIGDRLQISSAEFVVTQPRLPCFKLGIRFGRPDMVKRFLQSGRTGFYLSVLREGHVAAGDAIMHVRDQDAGVAVSDITSLYTSDADNQDLLRRATQSPALPDGWKNYFRERLWNPDV